MINTFANPQAFLLFLLLPLFIAWEIIKKKPTLQYADITLLTRTTAPHFSWAEMILLALKSLAMILLIIALPFASQS
jgi:hypothetical protein